MKNIYLYGASDDCCELETDFGVSAESYSQLKINDVVVDYRFDGDWGVKLIGKIPQGWKVMAIRGNCCSEFRDQKNAGQFIHIQVPGDMDIAVFEPQDEEVQTWRKVN